jgi:predicted dehydrogenase
MQVIEAGYPLLVEKPLAFDLAEADRLLAEAEKRGLFFAINFNHRYAKPMRLAREAIKADRLGDITHATWRFGGEANVSAHPHANLIETQCHGFDQLEDLCGPIASVMAEMTDRTGGGYRTMALALQFVNGAVGSMTGTYDSSYAYQDAHRLEVNGTRGRLVVEDTVQRFCIQNAGSEIAEVWQAGYFNDFDREFHRTFDMHLDAVMEAFKRGDQPPVHARAGRRALQLAWAAVESFQSGKRVTLAC